MILPIFLLGLLYCDVTYGLPQGAAPTCTLRAPAAEDFNGFYDAPRDFCTDQAPGSYTTLLFYKNWLNVDASKLQPPPPSSPPPIDPELSIVFAATPLTTKFATPSIEPYTRDGDTFDLHSMDIQCRSFCYNKDQPKLCIQAAKPMACDFSVKCMPADGSAAITLDPAAGKYSASDASANSLKHIDFTKSASSFKSLASCELTATTPPPVLLSLLIRTLTPLIKLGLSVTIFISQSKTGPAFFIDNVNTAIKVCTSS